MLIDGDADRTQEWRTAAARNYLSHASRPLQHNKDRDRDKNFYSLRFH